MSDREKLAALLAEHTPIVRPLLIECRGCAVSFGTDDAFSAHLAEAILARWALVSRPDAKNPTPALIEAAYIAQDDQPTAAEVAELRAAVLYSYQAGEPDLEAITSEWVRGIVSQPDGGLVDVIDTLAAVLEAPQRPPLGYVVGRETDGGWWTFDRFYGGPEPVRAGAEHSLAGAIEEDGPEMNWRLLEVREVTGRG